jgi:hypothetical protein
MGERTSANRPGISGGGAQVSSDGGSSMSSNDTLISRRPVLMSVNRMAFDMSCFGVSGYPGLGLDGTHIGNNLSEPTTVSADVLQTKHLGSTAQVEVKIDIFSVSKRFSVIPESPKGSTDKLTS